MIRENFRGDRHGTGSIRKFYCSHSSLCRCRRQTSPKPRTIL